MGGKGSWRRWRPRIVAGVILITLLGLLAGAIYTYASYREASSKLIVQRDRQVSLLTAVRLQSELAKLSGELEPLARSQSLYLGLTDRQRLFLRGQSQRLSVFDGGVVLMDNAGRVRATVPERWDIMSQDWSNQEFFRKMLVSEPPAQYFSPVLDIGPDNSPVVVMSVPVLGQNGEMVGVLAGMFRLGESRTSAFYASIVRLRLPGTGNTLILDDRGRVIYDSGYQRTGQMTDIAEVRAGLASSTLENVIPRLDAEGNEIVASYVEVPGTAWTLVTETDWVQAMAPIQQLGTGIIVLLVLGMVVPTLGVALLARGQRAGMIEGDQQLLEDRVTRAMRTRLLPPYTPMLSGWEVAVHHQSAAKPATAHDMYDYMLLPDGRLMISLATVADGGLGSVQLMTTARAAFRTAACGTLNAGNALSVCNNLICPDIGPHTAITSLLALLEPASGRLQVANAGFCAPMRWSGGDLTEMREGIDFLGQALGVEFEHDDVMLGPGDSMIFYSPGALGIRPETGEPFGPERVRHVLHASGAVGAQAVIDALRVDLGEFADANSLRRLDVTFLALSRSPAARAPEKPKRSLRDELRALGETEIDL